MKHNIVGWFEIPVTDMDRAIKFYETVMGVTFEMMPMGQFDMAMFPMEEGLGAGGALVQHPDYQPSATAGCVLYFTPPSGDLANELGRVEAAGGKVLQPKTLITEEIGYMGMFLDTEGNRMAIHSRQ